MGRRAVARRPAVVPPAGGLRPPHARAAERALLGAGRPGCRVPAGPSLAPGRRLGSSALGRPVAALPGEAAAALRRRRAARHGAAAEPRGAAPPPAARGGALVLAPVRRGGRVPAALRRALLRVAPGHAQVSAALSSVL